MFMFCYVYDSPVTASLLLTVKEPAESWGGGRNFVALPCLIYWKVQLVAHQRLACKFELHPHFGVQCVP